MHPARTAICGVALFAAVPAAAASFIVDAGSPIGTPTCITASPRLAGGAPLRIASGCSLAPSVPGTIQYDARATFGSVGGSSLAATTGPYFGTAFGVGTTSEFQDFVVFTSSDPLATSTIVAANLNLNGSLLATARGGASFKATYSLGSKAAYIFADSSGYVENVGLSFLSGTIGTGASNALVQSPFFLVPLNTPVFFGLHLTTNAGVAGDLAAQSAVADYAHSFELPLGMDAFALADGVTANAGTWLVNNRRVAADSVVPEPATWAIMLLGFGLAGAWLRRFQAATGLRAASSRSHSNSG